MLATFRSLRIRNYRLYASGAFVSNVGTWLQRVAQDWLVLHLSGSGTAVGITTALQFLPFLLITPFAGLLADRFPKRRVLMCTQLGMAGSAAALGLLDVTGVVQVWHVYVLAFLFGVASACDGPAKQSFVVELVGKDDLPNAVGLNSASFNGARMLGPALAGFLIVVAGTGWAILLNAVSYAATLFALSRLRDSELHVSEPVERKRGMLRDGLRYVRGRPDLLCVFAVVAFIGCFGMNFQLTSALMATEAFDKGAGEYGILGTIMAVGSLAGALVAAHRVKPRLRLVVVSAVAFAVLQILGGLMPTYLSFAVTLPALGFAALTLLTAANAIIQLSVRPEMRGRVMSLYMVLQIGTTPIGAPLIGWIGEQFGARWTLLVGGGVSLLGALISAYVLNRSAGLIVRAHLRPRPHVHVWRDQPEPEQVGTAGEATAPGNEPAPTAVADASAQRASAKTTPNAGTTPDAGTGHGGERERSTGADPVVGAESEPDAVAEPVTEPEPEPEPELEPESDAEAEPDAMAAPAGPVTAWTSPASARCGRTGPTPRGTAAARLGLTGRATRSARSTRANR